MEHLPESLSVLLGLVFILGMKHGFDPDHLATIDGLTRFNTAAKQPVARWCGFLFSLGHGVIVMTVALSVGLLTQQWAVPPWLEDAGAWISIAFLTALGTLNLWVAWKTEPGHVVRLVGLKGRMFGRLRHVSHPGLVALVGALFALSFDTMSQAVLFSMTAVGFGGWGYALLLGAAFMLGMMATDGINGLWISRLLRRSDQLACYASRAMSLAVALLSLLVAGLGMAKYFSPLVDSWSHGREIWLGMAIFGVMTGSFLIALVLSRRSVVVPGSTRP